MQALIDNDVFAKIANYSLLSEFGALLLAKGYTPPHGRLAAAPFKLKVWGKKAGTGWADVSRAQHLSAFFSSSTCAVTGPAETTIDQLNIPKFDAGEVKLLARALDQPASHILTGDKNALRALANEPALAPYAAQMAGRAIHFEMIIERLCLAHSYGMVRSAVLAAPGIDGAVYNALRNSNQALGFAALRASIEHLRASTGTLLAKSF